MSHRRGSVAALVAALIIVIPSSAPGQTGQSIGSAADQLTAKINAAQNANELPLLTNGDAGLVKAVFNPAAVHGLPTENPKPIIDYCDAISKALIAYGNFHGTGLESVAAALDDTVALGTATGDVCVERLFRATEVFMSGVSAERRLTAAEPLKQMRDGATETIDGTLGELILPDESSSDRSLMLSALLDDAPALAASYPAAERAKMRSEILSYLDRVPADSRDRLQRFADAFATSDCNILCQSAGQQ
jgi:hypothetical protein